MSVNVHLSGQERQGDRAEESRQLFLWESNPRAQSTQPSQGGGGLSRPEAVAPSPRREDSVPGWAHHLSDTQRGWQSLLWACFSGAYLQGCR